jgi:MFS family permease
MHPAAPPDDPLILSEAAMPKDMAAEAQIAGHQRRNFLALTIYQIILRSGWIFKTESIIMPAVLDLISDRPWVRAMLPLLNRLGQSVPPMLMSRRSQIAPRKSRMLLSTTLAMAICFGLLALLWLVTKGERTWWLPIVFLACYGIFFAAMGINQLVFSMTQGKLIEVTQRGRLLSVSNTLGAGLAIICAIVLLPQWLHEDTADVAEIFGFAAGCFFLSAVALLFLVEPADKVELPKQSIVKQFGHVLAPLTYDRNFQRLMYVGAMYGASMGLFPHYQYVGRNVVDLPFSRLIWWLIYQNVGMAMFSFLAGPVADRFGNRLVLRLSMLGLCAAPLLTLILSAYGPEAGKWYDLVFVLVGLTPVTYRTVQNYTLEICSSEDQSRYLSAVGLGMASTLILSPVLGWVMGIAGYALVFYIVTAMIASGWVVTWWLEEPRAVASDAVEI